MNSSPFYGAVLVERAALNRHDENLVKKAVDYLASIKSCNSPTLHLLLQSGYKPSRAAVQGLLSKSVPTSIKDIVVAKVVAHEYSEAIALLENDEHLGILKKLEYMVQVLILCRKWKAVDEINHRFTSYAKSKHSQYDVTDQNSHTAIRLLLCAAYNLQGRFLDCLQCFLTVLEEYPAVVSQLAGECEEPFCTHDELITMISVSMIVAIPLDNYENFVQLADLEPFYQVAKPLTKWLKLLIGTSYRDFLHEWELLNEKCSESIFLSQKWSAAKRSVRDKIYFFYLRISNTLEIPYLSETLCLDQSMVHDEIQMLIEELRLNFVIDGIVISYKERYNKRRLARGLLLSENLLQNKLESLEDENNVLRSKVQSSMNGQIVQQGSQLCGNSPQTNYLEENIDDCGFAGENDREPY
ncbi:LAME_0F13300g1_1 [Lachancea meyersii CBS 8951]|uniref:LAME_0F13300g1_1 n=1 Tax=Lachancea meyersii CBS 8951 TaxID=1266667 RepID=A0A1G4JXB7_9SACH|nr:LAME_0F13300g1_1 [Lachancea meyersii CBS 8951]